MFLTCWVDDGGGTPVQDEHPASDGDEVRSDRHQSEVRLIVIYFIYGGRMSLFVFCLFEMLVFKKPKACEPEGPAQCLLFSLFLHLPHLS